MPTPKKKLVNLSFPLKGFTENTPYGRVPEGYALDAQNVRPFSSGDRMRGSQRPGTARAIAQQVDGNNPVQRMAQITLASVQPIDQINGSWTWADNLHNVGSGVNGGGVGGGWLRFQPIYFDPSEHGDTNWPEPDPELDIPDDSGEEATMSEPLEAGTLSVDSTTETSITLSYTSPSGGIEPYTNTLQQEGSWIDLGEITPGTPFTVTDLTPNTSYTFRVKTTDGANSVVQSSFSAETVQATDEEKPAFVTDYRVKFESVNIHGNCIAVSASQSQRTTGSLSGWFAMESDAVAGQDSKDVDPSDLSTNVFTDTNACDTSGIGADDLLLMEIEYDEGAGTYRVTAHMNNGAGNARMLFDSGTVNTLPAAGETDVAANTQSDSSVYGGVGGQVTVERAS